MTQTPSRRTLILGAAASAVVVPKLLLPEAVIASASAAPAGKALRGPAHDWLDTFVAKKEYKSSRTDTR